MKLTIISPESVLFSGEAQRVCVPGNAGPFEILRGHAPIISSLGRGTITYAADSGKNSVDVAGGFVEVARDEVTACVELAVR